MSDLVWWLTLSVLLEICIISFLSPLPSSRPDTIFSLVTRCCLYKNLGLVLSHPFLHNVNSNVFKLLLCASPSTCSLLLSQILHYSNNKDHLSTHTTSINLFFFFYVNKKSHICIFNTILPLAPTIYCNKP